jgi:hypothetical protein
MPALLADIGGIFAVIFLLISFIGWIINMINTQNPPPAPNRGPQRRPRARDSKVQNEIEQFLQEAMGNKDARREEVPADQIEVVEVAPQRRPPTPRRESRPPARPMQRVSVEQPAQERPRPTGGVSSRQSMPSTQFTPSTLGTKPASTLGTKVSAHVKDHMRERVSQETTRHLPHAVNQNVTQHLGEVSAGLRDVGEGVRPVFHSLANIPDPSGLIGQLRSPSGMRAAIVLQEILARPRALRK